MLDVRRLRLLRDLSVYGTVAATAEALHLTGPAVSQQLATLEREAGLPLLEKHGRTLRLTPAGSRLVAHADVILGTLAAADADLQALRGSRRGTVRIAAFPSAARVLLPRVWRLLDGDEGGRPELRIAEHEPDAATSALRHGAADVAIVHAYSLLPRDLPPGCEAHRLADEPVLLAVHPDEAARRGLAAGRPADRPAGRPAGQPASLAAFADAEWLMPGPDTACYELTRRACGAAGFVPAPIAVATDFAVLTALVAAGAGVALIPQMALPSVAAGVSLHPLTTPVTRTISALTRAGEAAHPRLSRVLDHLRTAASA